MAIESKRGCGFRKVGGLYLVGGIFSAPCDRLPIPLNVCPVCGCGIKVGRGFTKINPFKLWGIHDGSLVGLVDDQPITAICKDKVRPCIVCDPPDGTAYIMGVGERYYTPQSFAKEGRAMGVSKRIAAVPKDFNLGETIVYLAHPKACIKNGSGETKKGQGTMLEYQMGVFSAFVPQRIEKLVWEKDLKGKKGERLTKQLKKRGITPVAIPDGDTDHK